jgi:hypothetical protein
MMLEARRGTPTPISLMALQWHFMGIVLPPGSSIDLPWDSQSKNWGKMIKKRERAIRKIAKTLILHLRDQ